ncbi:MAG: DsrE family protein [Rhodocyclaceae bacterium]|nr:DsrE family protein [Rhodocyclaceae bacterium]
MATTLFILNDPPCGTERRHTALRLARPPLKKAEGKERVRVLLMGDAAARARPGPTARQDLCNIADTPGMGARAGGAVGVCGTRMDARGITEATPIRGAHRGTRDERAAWTRANARVTAF